MYVLATWFIDYLFEESQNLKRFLFLVLPAAVRKQEDGGVNTGLDQ
jgi:hypothetical protein